jgi:cell division protein FtsN
VAKDYAKKSRSPSRGGSSIPGWVWLLTGIVTGAFIMFLVYLSGVATNQHQSDSSSAVADKQSPKPNLEKPVFEFYDTLMNNEVIAPPAPQTSNAPEVIYMLQAASFKKLAEADSLRAKLILEGMDSSIAEFNNRGEIYHRVMVGPFTDAEKMTQAKKSLAAHNINPIVLQKKPGT